MNSGIRLMGGVFGGRHLLRVDGIRPTSGRVREALFSIWGERLVSAGVLDLFAGSGAVGLEALGRGADSVTAVEANARVLRVLRANVGELEMEDRVTILRGTLPAILSRQGQSLGSFDLIFADPPYKFNDYAELLRLASPHLDAAGELAIEHRWGEKPAESPEGVLRIDTRRYGDSALSLFRRDASVPLES